LFSLIRGFFDLQIRLFGGGGRLSNCRAKALTSLSNSFFSSTSLAVTSLYRFRVIIFEI
jgi:hypothetical protein